MLYVLPSLLWMEFGQTERGANLWYQSRPIILFLSFSYPYSRLFLFMFLDIYITNCGVLQGTVLRPMLIYVAGRRACITELRPHHTARPPRRPQLDPSSVITTHHVGFMARRLTAPSLSSLTDDPCCRHCLANSRHMERSRPPFLRTYRVYAVYTCSKPASLTFAGANYDTFARTELMIQKGPPVVGALGESELT
ncbi:hypothetical protein J6590_027043 [Homalodisca vitripennis]|nr:hypothetical protein J6590_027043 [Homalodisca vitripennis]